MFVSSTRAAVLFAAAGVGSVLGVKLLGSFTGPFTVFLAALFISFALEPAVNALNRRGVDRRRATRGLFAAVFAVSIGFVYSMFSIVGGQTKLLVARGPQILRVAQDDARRWFGYHFDPAATLKSDQFAAQVAGSYGRLTTLISSTLAGIFAVGAIIITAYFLSADGPAIRRSICGRLRPEQQLRVLRLWERSIERTGRYLFSRVILGVVSAIGHTVAFAVIGVPYPVALGLWVGVASQAVPLVGTYLAGLLPALVALSESPSKALAVVLFVTVFQQIENHTLGPILSRRTVHVHPAVAFGAVIAGTSLLGAIGAVLAVPLVAIVQSLLAETHAAPSESG